MIPGEQGMILQRMHNNSATAPKCPICECSSSWKEVTTVRYQQAGDGSYVTDGTRHMACQNCGLVLKFAGDVA